MKTKPDFLKDADNVYRTKEFIVKQSISIHTDESNCEIVMSTDTYYKRTLFRDFQYELYFSKRKRINGRRLPTNSYTRTYID